MSYLNIVNQKNISEQQLLEICNIKSVFGDYGIDSQKRWIINNLEEDDIHFLLYEDEVLVAYLNLVNVQIFINGYAYTGYGIGNVCSKEKGSGLGTKILSRLNEFLLKTNKLGYLFCKENLMSFYLKNGWTVLNSDDSAVLENKEIKSMIFNFNKKINSLEYTGRLF